MDPWPRPAPDAPLWRYLPLWKFESLLAERALYFRRAGLLADPLEGTAPATNRAVRPTLLQRYPHFRPWIEPLDAFEAQARRETYLNCWFGGEREDGAMWDDYAEGGRGVAIRTTVARLEAALAPGTGRTVVVLQVRYINRERERFVELGNTLYWYAHKDERFAHEREVRAITIHHDFDAQPAGLFIPVDVTRLFEQIVVGPRAPAETVLRVHDLLADARLPDRIALSMLALR